MDDVQCAAVVCVLKDDETARESLRRRREGFLTAEEKCGPGDENGVSQSVPHSNSCTDADGAAPVCRA
jgi:hypothetical protein